MEEYTEIRILPMSSDYEFPNKNYLQVQKEFFIEDLKNRPKVNYKFRNKYMVASNGTLVLFQFRGQIIASAILEGYNLFDSSEGVYNGEYYFDRDSIKIFTPITSGELSEIVPEFKRFSQVQQKIGNEYCDKIIKLITHNNNDLIKGEFNEV